MKTGMFRFLESLEPRLEPAAELAFRRAYLPDDKRMVIKLVFVWGLANLLLGIKERLFSSPEDPSLSSLLLRAVFILLAAVVALGVARTRDSRLFDRWCLLILAVVFLNQELFFVARPPDYPFASFPALLILVAVFFLVPLPIMSRAVVPLAIGLFESWYVLFRKALPFGGQATILVTYWLLFYVGLVGSAQIFRTRRERFLGQLQLKRKNDELERAQAQIKTLDRLLPICACCKKIRDDAGYWHQVEVYIRDHSETQFSHGLCPECVDRLYPDLGLDT